MNWFWIALFAPALWSITNHIDKYLLSKYVKGATSGALIIFSSIFGIFALPFILIFEQNIFNIGSLDIFLIISSGILYLLGVIPYFKALEQDDASVVIPMFQTIPIFGFIYAYFLLGETLTSKQILASILIIIGAIAISLDLEHKIPKLKKSILFYMVLSSATFAGVDLLFKFVAINEGFWISTFWHFVGYVIFAIFVLIFIKTYRQQFMRIMSQNKIPVIGLNSLNELLNIVARGMFGFASLLAPLALVQVVNGFQPFFVFIFGIILTLFFPHLGSEKLTKKSIYQKIVAIIIIFVGTYLLNY